MPNEQQACAATKYEVTVHDLPLCCPMPSMAVWNAHPRVYLPITTEGHVTCPYCSAIYVLTDETVSIDLPHNNDKPQVSSS